MRSRSNAQYFFDDESVSMVLAWYLTPHCLCLLPLQWTPWASAVCSLVVNNAACHHCCVYTLCCGMCAVLLWSVCMCVCVCLLLCLAGCVCVGACCCVPAACALFVSCIVVCDIGSGCVSGWLCVLICGCVVRLSELQVDRVLCVGCPRIHEAILRAGVHALTCLSLATAHRP